MLSVEASALKTVLTPAAPLPQSTPVPAPTAAAPAPTAAAAVTAPVTSPAIPAPTPTAPAAPPDRSAQTPAILPVPTLPAEMVPSRRIDAEQALPGNEAETAPRSVVEEALPGPQAVTADGKAAMPTAVALAATAPPGEVELVAGFDSAIAVVRDFSPSVDDATRLRDAFASVSRVDAARQLRDQISDPVARKMVDWALLRAGQGSAKDISAFLDKNPGWPNRELMTQRMEEQVFLNGGTARDIKAFFAAAPPKTGTGRAAVASALLAEGQEAEAKALASAAWRGGEIPASLEVGFLERFGKVLGEADHKARFDHYLVELDPMGK